MTIVTLQTVTKPALKVDEETVGLLRRLLERAEAGEFNGVALATVELAGAGQVVSVATCYAGEGIRQSVHTAIGGVAVLEERMKRELLEW